jgi:hypothetical protein
LLVKLDYAKMPGRLWLISQTSGSSCGQCRESARGRNLSFVITTGEGLLNKTESLRNWLIILVLLIVTGVVTAVWPLLNLGVSLGFGPARPPAESPTIVFPVPAFLVEMLGTEIVLTSAQILLAFVVLLISVAITTGVVGLVLSFLIRMLDKSATAVANDPEYQGHVTTLEKRQQEKLKNVRANSPKPNTPEAYVYHLDPMSLSLLILLIVGLIGTLIYGSLAPTGEFTLLGQTFSSALPILLVLYVITIPLLAWRVRRQWLLSIAEKDHAPIPWDFVAVLVAGLLIVGIGLGLMLFLNNPA